MKKLLIVIALFMCSGTTLYDFSSNNNPGDWYIVDDGVMGGRSNGSFSINSEGHGVFSGIVSLENNGGFSSVRHRFRTKDVSGFSKFLLHVKGDGKRYQFRAKTNSRDYASYVFEFKTDNDWTTIEIPFNEMYPSYRGRRLGQPNYEGELLSEITFLIANKKAEAFKLEIDKIELK
jgi:hypothetical protein